MAQSVEPATLGLGGNKLKPHTGGRDYSKQNKTKQTNKQTKKTKPNTTLKQKQFKNNTGAKTVVEGSH